MFLGTRDQGPRERPGAARQAQGRVWGDVRERPRTVRDFWELGGDLGGA